MKPWWLGKIPSNRRFLDHWRLISNILFYSEFVFSLCLGYLSMKFPYILLITKLYIFFLQKSSMTTSVRQTSSSNPEPDNGYISSESHSNGGINSRRSLKTKIFDNLAKRPVGQFFLRSIDHWLWTFEKTIAWMSPGSQRPEGLFSPTSLTTLERPLPWIFFLPALFLIRVGFILIGSFSKFFNYIPITPEEAVSLILIHHF